MQATTARAMRYLGASLPLCAAAVGAALMIASPAEKVDNIAAFECGDHQADGSVRKAADEFDAARN